MCGTGETLSGLLFEALGQIRSFKLSRFMRIASERECESPATIGGLWVVIERPVVASAVIANRRGPKLAGNERRDECAARLVFGRDESHGQPSAADFGIQVQAKGAYGASALESESGVPRPHSL